MVENQHRSDLTECWFCHKYDDIGVMCSGTSILVGMNVATTMRVIPCDAYKLVMHAERPQRPDKEETLWFHTSRLQPLKNKVQVKQS